MVKKNVTIEEAQHLGDLFSIDYNVVPLEQFQFGLNVELEHGRRNELTNVTDDDLIKTAKIAIAHLLEFPNYYQKLKLMESQLEEEWKNKHFVIFRL
jgi:hypothetical protein